MFSADRDLGVPNKTARALEGHRLQASLLRQDLLWLYVLFAAMPPAMLDVAASQRGTEGAEKALTSDPIARLYEDYFESEVTRSLVQPQLRSESWMIKPDSIQVIRITMWAS